MPTSQQLTRPTVLTEQYAGVARGLIDVYVGKDQTRPFDGASFETIGHRWDDPATVNVITAADLVALSTLSVPVPASAAIALLGPDADTASELLEEIPADLSLADATPEVLDVGSAAARPWRLVRSYEDMGPTRTSKLLARKRPFLVPIFDSVVEKVLGMSGSAGHWEGMRSLLTAEGGNLHRHLLQLRVDAELPEYVSPLRVFDIVVWMHGARPELSARLAAEAGRRSRHDDGATRGTGQRSTTDQPQYLADGTACSSSTTPWSTAPPTSPSRRRASSPPCGGSTPS